MISFVELTNLVGGKIWIRTDHISFFHETRDDIGCRHSRIEIAAPGWHLDFVVEESPEEVARRLIAAGRHREIFPSPFNQNG